MDLILGFVKNIFAFDARFYDLLYLLMFIVLLGLGNGLGSWGIQDSG